ncbi:MAG: GntR family transcriptional regulator [Spirochaetales bacterium]|nr:GntR family transcriptional regulator [Spirochaetales bacterium]
MEPVENVALKEYLYKAIKDMVDRGELKIGEKISKPDLAKKFNVSQTPVNDVLNRLVGEGYIAMESRKGFFVKEVTDEDLCQAFEMRAGIEMIAVRLCCEKATDDEINELSSLFNDFSLPLDDEAYKRYIQVDNEFHQKIIQYSGNVFLAQSLTYSGFLVRSNRKGLVRPPEETLEEHRAISDALKKREGEKASSCMMRHLLASRELIREAMKKNQ